MMRVLALCSYPIESAATRFRLAQFIEPLQRSGIDFTIAPFLTGAQFEQMYLANGMAGKVLGLAGSVMRRISQLANARKYDLLFVQREAMFFGPGIFELLYQRIGRLPMVLDLDDATYVRYVSPSYGRLGSALKFFGKTDNLIDHAELVICGNRFIADHVEKRGAKQVVIPTIVDTDVFKPIEKENEVPVVGWVGTHSTFQFIERLFPVLADLAQKHRFELKIVGSGKAGLGIDGLEIENLPWKLEREVSDFQSLDIGLYPLNAKGSLDPAWLAGKSGFKAIQYMAVGIPFVMSPIGVCAEIGESGRTHFNAETEQDWYNCLDNLLSDRELGKQMGGMGRQFSEEHYGLARHAHMLADALRSVIAGT